MPPIETICISFGNWIAAFPVVYAMVAVAVVAASAALIDWTVNKARASQVGSAGRVNRGSRIIEARA
jgi:hypothetical protein